MYKINRPFPVVFEFFAFSNLPSPLLTYRFKNMLTNHAFTLAIQCINLHHSDKNYPWTLYNTLENSIIYFFQIYSLDHWEFIREVISHINISSTSGVLFYKSEQELEENAGDSSYSSTSQNDKYYQTYKTVTKNCKSVDQIKIRHKEILATGLISKCQRINKIFITNMAAAYQLSGVGPDENISNYIVEIAEAVNFITPIYFNENILAAFPTELNEYYQMIWEDMMVEQYKEGMKKSKEVNIDYPKLAETLDNLVVTSRKIPENENERLIAAKAKSQLKKVCNDTKDSVSKTKEHELKLKCDQLQAQLQKNLETQAAASTSSGNNAQQPVLSCDDWIKCETNLICVAWNFFTKLIEMSANIKDSTGNSNNQPVSLKDKDLERFFNQLEDVLMQGLIQAFHKFSCSQLSEMVDIFADYFLIILTSTVGQAACTNKINILKKMIWKYKILDFDRFVMSLLLRDCPVSASAKGNSGSSTGSSDVMIMVINLFFSMDDDLKNRVVYWTALLSKHGNDNHEEELYQDFIKRFEPVSTWKRPEEPIFPIYYSNVCIRFIPIYDFYYTILLSDLGNKNSTVKVAAPNTIKIYRSHPKPIQFVYKMFIYYFDNLKTMPEVKKRLFWSIFTTKYKPSSENSHPIISEAFINMPECSIEIDWSQTTEILNWRPESNYFARLFERLCKAMYDPHHEFRKETVGTSEFKCRVTEILIVTIVELLVLPGDINGIFSRLIEQTITFPSYKISQKINVLTLLLIHLPRPFKKLFYDMIINNLNAEPKYTPKIAEYSDQIFNFEISANSSNSNFKKDPKIAQMQKDHSMRSITLALAHCFFTHCNMVELAQLPNFLEKSVLPRINDESQFLYLCHLIGPSLLRIHTDREQTSKQLLQIFYEILQKSVEKYVKDPKNNKIDINNVYLIADILYYFKYRIIGQLIDDTIKKVFQNLPFELQEQLKHMIGDDSNKMKYIVPDRSVYLRNSFFD